MNLNFKLSRKSISSIIAISMVISYFAHVQFYRQIPELQADTSAPTVIDITSLASNSTSSHSHIWLDEYDDIYMWQRCSLCDEIRNKKPHNVLIKYAMGETNPSCNNKKIYYSTECGYYKEEPYKYPYKESAWQFNGDVTVFKYDDDVKEIHDTDTGYKKVGDNFVPINSIEPKIVDVYKVIKDANGRFVGVKAGVKDTNRHVCNIVEKDITYELISDTKLRIKFKFKIPDEVIEKEIVTSEGLKRSSWLPLYMYDERNAGETYTASDIINYNYNEATHFVSGEFDVALRYLDKKQSYPLNFSWGWDYHSKLADYSAGTTGTYYSFFMGGHSMNTNIWDPELYSATITPADSIVGFSKTATLNATGKIIGSATGYYTILDSSGNIVKPRSPFTINDDNTFNISTSLQGIENTDTAQTYILKVEDYFGKSITRNITLPKMDSKAPVLTNRPLINLNSEWATSKILDLSYMDVGSGAVQTSINSDLDYQNADGSGSNFNKKYKFVGDIYSEKNIAVYSRDAVGNFSTEILSINKIDNTPPTVTSLVAGSDRLVGSTTLTATANDRNTTLNAEGSGVTYYKFTCTDNVVNERNSSLNTWITSNSVSITEPGTYYVEVKDLVGLVSDRKSIVISKPNLERITLENSSPVNVQANVADLDSALSTDVTLTCDNGYHETLRANNWVCSEFNPEVAGTYTFTNRLTLPETMTNTNNLDLTVTRDVVVSPTLKEITYTPDAVEVDYGTSLDDVISRFTEQATLKDTDNSERLANIDNWTSDTYNPKQPGRYAFTGTIDLPEHETNYLNRDLSVARLVVVNPPTISSTTSIGSGDGDTPTVMQEITVPYGTTYEAMLERINPKVRVTLNNGDNIDFNINKRDIQFTPAYNKYTPQISLGSLVINSYLPEVVSSALSSDLIMSYSVTVQKPKASSIEFIDPSQVSDPDDPSNSFTIGLGSDIIVPFNTEESIAKSKLPTTLKVVADDNSTLSIPLTGEWVCDNYNKQQPNSYTFRYTGDLSSILNITDYDITMNIIVRKATYQSVTYDDSSVSLEPSATAEDLKLLLPTSVMVTGSDGYLEEVPLSLDNWDISGVNLREAGNYEVSYRLPLDIRLEAPMTEVILTKPITINNPSVGNIDFRLSMANAIHVPYGTSFEEVKHYLVSSISTELNNGTNYSLPVNSATWSCPQYNPKESGVYKATNTITLPAEIHNINDQNLNIAQLIIVDNRSIREVATGSFPEVEVQYGTPLDTVLSRLSKVGSFILNDGSTINKNLDLNTWTHNYSKSSIPENYPFLNTTYIEPSSSSYTHLPTAEEIPDLTENPEQPLRVDVSQLVKVVNRKIVAIEPLDRISTKYKTVDEALNNLPRRFSVLFSNNGDKYLATNSRGWSIKSYDKSTALYTFVTEVDRPEYSDGSMICEIRCIVGTPQSTPTGGGRHSSSDISMSTTHSVKIPNAAQDTSTEGNTQEITNPLVTKQRKSWSVTFELGSENWYKNDVLQDTKLDVPPEVAENRLCLPMRYVAYALGIKENDIKWNPKTRLATIYKDGSKFDIPANNNVVMVGEQFIPIDGVTYLQKGRIMLPLSQICKVLLNEGEYDIQWDPELQQVKLIITAFVDVKDK